MFSHVIVSFISYSRTLCRSKIWRQLSPSMLLASTLIHSFEKYFILICSLFWLGEFPLESRHVASNHCSVHLLSGLLVFLPYLLPPLIIVIPCTGTICPFLRVIISLISSNKSLSASIVLSFLHFRVLYCSHYLKSNSSLISYYSVDSILTSSSADFEVDCSLKALLKLLIFCWNKSKL
jgi:hypothetical protein